MRSGEHSTKKTSFWRKHKGFRILVVVVATLLFAGVVFLGVTNTMVIGTAGPHITSASEASEGKADAIIVPGAYVFPDSTPSDILKDRLDNAIVLYEAGAAPKIIVSGDHGTTDYDEVQGMKQYAISKGVPADDIFCDHAGFSTYESMYRAKHVFGAERIIVSTQTYHLYRALYDALGLGLDATGVASDFSTFAQQPFWEAREALARTKDLFAVLVQSPPTFVGEPISLDGPGSVTDG